MDTVRDEECTLIVPAYNEEKRIQRFLSDILPYKGPVVFICDGCDKTAGIVQSFAKENECRNILVMVFEERLGKGGGILEGIKVCKTKYAGFVDADGSTPLYEVQKLFSGLAGYDCTIGSRWLAGAKIEKKQRLTRLIQSRMFNIFVRLFLGLSFHDTQCGAKTFRKKALDEILPKIQSTGFEFDAEVLYLLVKNGFSVKEVPIEWKDTDESHVGSSDGLKMFTNLLKIRFRCG
ncbi:glycosyltransferase involved in cell wall biosynthesis [Methanomicrobium sp. W14]|jgi:glycosyltransferase involved in cell wall biosynthesis|uniref:glycosyltransferase n=1 Tax=Methanomicrobium sp. W14 TaxID=2817839 RepID=UPI001AE5CA39|nr:glycosyltransferase [Methanomicrobium sp. W14]MBP2134558.1 glycosyltransferase involved in cell wall biosynthesis [Methanomicrobium sp. W14]